MCSFLCLLVAHLEDALGEAKCPVGFVDKGVDMDAHVNIICTSQSKVMSMPLSNNCLLYTSPSPRDSGISRMPSSA